MDQQSKWRKQRQQVDVALYTSGDVGDVVASVTFETRWTQHTARGSGGDGGGKMTVGTESECECLNYIVFELHTDEPTQSTSVGPRLSLARFPSQLHDSLFCHGSIDTDADATASLPHMSLTDFHHQSC